MFLFLFPCSKCQRPFNLFSQFYVLSVKFAVQSFTEDEAYGVNCAVLQKAQASRTTESQKLGVTLHSTHLIESTWIESTSMLKFFFFQKNTEALLEIESLVNRVRGGYRTVQVYTIFFQFCWRKLEKLLSSQFWSKNPQAFCKTPLNLVLWKFQSNFSSCEPLKSAPASKDFWKIDMHLRGWWK